MFYNKDHRVVLKTTLDYFYPKRLFYNCVAIKQLSFVFTISILRGCFITQRNTLFFQQGIDISILRGCFITRRDEILNQIDTIDFYPKRLFYNSGFSTNVFPIWFDFYPKRLFYNNWFKYIFLLYGSISILRGCFITSERQILGQIESEFLS